MASQIASWRVLHPAAVRFLAGSGASSRKGELQSRAVPKPVPTSRENPVSRGIIDGVREVLDC